MNAEAIARRQEFERKEQERLEQRKVAFQSLLQAGFKIKDYSDESYQPLRLSDHCRACGETDWKVLHSFAEAIKAECRACGIHENLWD